MAPNVTQVTVQQERSGHSPTQNPKPPGESRPAATATAIATTTTTPTAAAEENSPPPRTETTTTERAFGSESERLRTFVNWPVPFINKRDLARAGFRYKGSDIVKCVFCGVEIGRWEEGDDPLREHERWAPLCPFIRNRSVNNSNMEESVAIRTVSYDTCGPYGIQIRPNSSPEPTPSCSSLENLPSLDKLGIHSNRAPAWPKYGTQEARLASFDGWPLAIKQRPDKLSEAGFFYTGKGDQTVCFHCGGGLKDWEENDDPWVEHALWFSKCVFVNLVKGKDFVENVGQNKEAIITAKEAKNIKRSSDENAPTETASSSSGEKLPSNAKEDMEIDDVRLCKICFQEEMGVLFLPCGHIVACVKCAPSLSTCAVCRKEVTATVRAFLS